MYTLLITRDYIIKNSYLDGSIDSDKIEKFIRPAQDKYLINILGSVLFNKMMTDVGSGTELDDTYAELLKLIRICLMWYVVSEYLPFSFIQIKNDGAYIVNNEQYVSASRNDVDYLTIKALDNAEVYSKRLQKFLLANSDKIKEYTSTTGKSDNIFPDTSNQFFSGINL